VTKTEVKKRIRAGALERRGFSHTSCVRWKNYDHAARVAFLVANPTDDPVCIDVGIPSLGHYCLCIEDGNHRLAAAYVSGKDTISLTYSGAEDEFFYHFPDAVRIYE
jgi:hypothetical protein